MRPETERPRRKRRAKPSKVKHGTAERRSKFVQRAKPIAECTNAELLQVRDIAKAHANRMLRPELADDFASFLLEDLVRQGTLYYNLRWRWAQYLRTERGNLTNKKGRAKAYATAKPIAIDLEAEGSAPLQVPDPDPMPDTSDPWEYVKSHLKGNQRIIAVLKFKWGLTECEIGEVFGCTTQNINRQLHDLYMYLRKRKLAVPKVDRNDD